VVGQEPTYLVALTAFGTTLAMNFLQRGNFTGDKRRSAKSQKSEEQKSKEQKSKEPRAKGKDAKLEARS